MTRKLVVSAYSSLDGVIQDPVGMEDSGLGNWVGPFDRGPRGDEIIHHELFAADIVLLGRTTYDGFAAVWPHVEDETGFATRLNSMPKYVASRRIAEASWNNTTVIGDDVPGTIERLKSEGDGDILATAAPDWSTTSFRLDWSMSCTSCSTRLCSAEAPAFSRTDGRAGSSSTRSVSWAAESCHFATW